MNRAINWFRLFFCTFSGEDDYIIRECKPRIQISFALIGLFVLIVFAGCWVSASSFMSELFEGSGKWLSIPIGIIWALLVANMYLLLLYTVSPTLLPVARKNTGKGKKRKFVIETPNENKKSEFTPSLLFRILFISLLAIIIAQPLNVLLLSSFFEKSLANHKTEYRINMMIVADSSLIKQEVQNQTEFYQNLITKIHVSDSITVANNVQILNAKVANDQNFLVQSKMLLDSLLKWNKSPFTKSKQKSDSVRIILSTLLDEELKSDDAFVSEIDSIQFTDKRLQSDFERYRASLKKTIEAKIENYARLNELLEKSNFYVKKIQILISENPVSWIITIIVCGIFLLPIYWKFSIRNHGGFYEKKKHIENKIVHDDYNDFKSTYSKIFETKLREYNRQTWVTAMHLLNKIEKINLEKFSDMSQQLKKEITDEHVSKYEYWADPPFRTKRKQSSKQLLSEKDFIKTIYPDTI
ncbi:MAG: DUF4407 domain-containing protein [Verrucomicrobia bacterium]|nr:DUF4407 domain-containing protein [Verrucomicrobiota bacterium]